jgi:hypothetical protein
MPVTIVAVPAAWGEVTVCERAAEMKRTLRTERCEHVRELSKGPKRTERTHRTL